jgi:hypothetical protein
VLRSTATVGVWSARLSKTFTRPLFSATKTRPSGAKRIAVGFVRPENATSSWKPFGSASAGEGPAEAPRNPPSCIADEGALAATTRNATTSASRANNVGHHTLTFDKPDRNAAPNPKDRRLEPEL